MNSESAQMIEGFGAHINTGILTRILQKRGGAYRTVAPLADKIVELEGWGKLHLQAAALRADMVIIIEYKVLMTLQRMGKIEEILPHCSERMRGVMERVLDGHCEYLYQLSQEVTAMFGTDATNRLMSVDHSGDY